MRKDRNKIWISLLVSVGISILLKIVLPEPENDILSYDRFWTVKTFDSDKYDVIFGGDSRIYRGISPEHAEEILDNAKVKNLGYSSGGYSVEMFDLIRNQLDENGKKIVVLGITPFSLSTDALKNGHLKSILEETPSTRFKHLTINPLISAFNPYKMDYLIFGWVSHIGDHYFQKYFDNGWVKSDRIPHSIEEALASYRKTFENSTVTNEAIDEFFYELSNLQSDGISVYGFIPPSSDQMVSLEDSLSGFDRSAFIRRFKNSGATWISLENEDFFSYDGSHLHYESAIKLSKTIAQKIKIEN